MRPGERKYMTREKLAFVAKHNLLVTCSDPGSAPLRDIVSGNNDTDALLNSKYQAGPGWDACTGWGAPDEVKLLKALQTPAA
ncbi:hypothetical protein Y958_24035 [Nitrospirillum viridazoti CBAmc]|uniref:Uncharacterized protein n=2 Tax=Nitrospirillum TaxID=1543705 RepID=A0A248K0Q8_9PROT|nr:hypothetical protein Y958_24035 [Nitrospirillum amazonense CBAmc]